MRHKLAQMLAYWPAVISLLSWRPYAWLDGCPSLAAGRVCVRVRVADLVDHKE